jgi:hypothetical protein
VITTARGRAGQFFAALSVRRRPPDPGAAHAILPPALSDLFDQMLPEDRRHGLAVLALLKARGESAAPLLAAGLLHDVGKSGAGVRLHHRIARVLLRRTVPPVWRFLTGRPTGWRRPYWVMAHHPARGAVWVATRGGDADLVALIRYHEAPPPADWAGTQRVTWHAALAWADARD